jgi:hypothetical protein
MAEILLTGDRKHKESRGAVVPQFEIGSWVSLNYLTHRRLRHQKMARSASPKGEASKWWFRFQKILWILNDYPGGFIKEATRYFF